MGNAACRGDDAKGEAHPGIRRLKQKGANEKSAKATNRNGSYVALHNNTCLGGPAKDKACFDRCPGDRSMGVLEDYPEPEYDESTLCDKPCVEPLEAGQGAQELCPKHLRWKGFGIGMLVLVVAIFVTCILTGSLDSGASSSQSGTPSIVNLLSSTKAPPVAPAKTLSVLLPVAGADGKTTWEPVPIAVPSRIPAEVCAGDIRSFPKGKRRWCCDQLGIHCDWLREPLVAEPLGSDAQVRPATSQATSQAPPPAGSSAEPARSPWHPPPPPPGPAPVFSPGGVLLPAPTPAPMEAVEPPAETTH